MNELKEQLVYIIKSHACTQVLYDKASMEDYPKMIDKLMQLIETYTNKNELEATKPFYDAFNNKGSHPDYHDEQVAYLKSHWRTLYDLLNNLKDK